MKVFAPEMILNHPALIRKKILRCGLRFWGQKKVPGVKMYRLYLEPRELHLCTKRSTAAARDFDTDEIAQAADVSYIPQGLGYAHMRQKICRRNEKTPSEPSEGDIFREIRPACSASES